MMKMERIRKWVRSLLRPLKDSRGVSLYEITAAVAMTAILAAVAVPVILDQTTESKRAATLQLTQTIYTAMNNFKTHTGKWPGESESLAVLLSSRTAELPGRAGTLIIGPFCQQAGKCGDFNDYLLDNPNTKIPGASYQNWQGPYITGGARITTDLFDRAIAVNVQALTRAEVNSTQNTCGYAWVLSGGPNRELETTFFDASLRLDLQSDDIGSNNGKKSPPGIGCLEAPGS